MLASPHSEEGQVIGWVQVSHHTPGLGCQLLDLASILYSGGIVQGGANRDACEMKIAKFWGAVSCLDTK